MSERACVRCRKYHVVLAGEAGAELVPAGDGLLEPLPRLGECRARPPAVFMLAVNAPRLDAKLGVNVNFPAAWPQTQPLAWCAEFEPKVDHA